MSRTVRMCLAVAVIATLSIPAIGQRKKKKDPEDERTQQLEVLPDPPAATTVETARLGFAVAPLSTKGLLSQQTRDALKALQRLDRGGQIVKVRAFVAGTGDMRRVQSIVSEEFSDRKQPLPALSVIQIGQLPLEGAQVLLEATIQERKPVNPHGVAFFSGQQVPFEGKVENPLAPVLPLIEKSLANLGTAASAAGVTAPNMMRVTCLVSSLADQSAVTSKIAQTYPQSAISVVQLQRGPVQPIVECEAVGRLSSQPSTAVHLVNPSGLASSPNYSQVAIVKSQRLLMTGGQMAFGSSDADVKLAFDRMKRVLESTKGSYADVFFTHFYPLSNGIAEKIRATRFNYLDKTRPPASTMILFEGLPSLDASFAMEMIATAN